MLSNTCDGNDDDNDDDDDVGDGDVEDGDKVLPVMLSFLSFSFVLLLLMLSLTSPRLRVFIRIVSAVVARGAVGVRVVAVVIRDASESITLSDVSITSLGVDIYNNDSLFPFSGSKDSFFVSSGSVWETSSTLGSELLISIDVF